MGRELNKTYDPNASAEKLYKYWEDNGYFKAEVNKSKNPFAVVMPPPNITGNLHMGHALDETIQDVIIRFKRMQGYSALWVPGTDHAAIATEAKIVEKMREEGISKEDIGKDEFLKRAWEWKRKYGGNIVKQLKKMGVSCDWSKERFTLDEGCSRAVKEFFVYLYEKGLIYRGERIINWCPKCCTSISDSEVEFKELSGHFWHVKYKLSGEEKYVEVATTRPETMFGDVALAVNPKDERYKDIVGKKAVIPIVNREIPIIADDYVDIDTGTGVLKITPAHDPNDFEIGLKHNLGIINVMDEKGRMNENALSFNGMDRYEARKKFVDELKNSGYISNIKEIKHNVGKCYRCDTVIEPRVSNQWFVKMKELAKPAVKCVQDAKACFIPTRFDKIYYHWLENIKDWCISRQLWWGHRLPVWYCEDCGEIIVSKEENIAVCPKCKSKKLKAEEDTLDTWFSSGLWPLSVLGWPEKTDELDYFFPTEVLVTGYDIIFFWVIRMMVSSLELTKEPPFKHILIHGLLRDSQGRKMSKSLGNGIDPIEVIKNYGADALRFSLMLGVSPGNDMRFSAEKIESSRNFANKIWNAARFVHMNICGNEEAEVIPQKPGVTDCWILSRLSKVTKEVTQNINKYELGLAAQKLYDFIWDEFCDWYIEFSKIKGEKGILLHVMKSILKLIHPFMPFVTEEIWQSFLKENEKSSVMVSNYPVSEDAYINENAEKDVEVLISIIKSIRNIRHEMNVPQGKKTTVYIETLSQYAADVLNSHKDIILKLSYSKEINVSGEFNLSKCAAGVSEYAKIYIPVNEIIDRESEILRLKKELELSEKQLEQVNSRLKNKDFISKAPQSIVQGAKDMAENLKIKVEKLNKSILEI